MYHKSPHRDWIWSSHTKCVKSNCQKKKKEFNCNCQYLRWCKLHSDSPIFENCNCKWISFPKCAYSPSRMIDKVNLASMSWSTSRDFQSQFQYEDIKIASAVERQQQKKILFFSQKEKKQIKKLRRHVFFAFHCVVCFFV